jgi:hypothetical protein
MFPGGFVQLEEAKRLPTGAVIRLEAFVRSLSHGEMGREREQYLGPEWTWMGRAVREWQESCLDGNR